MYRSRIKSLLAYVFLSSVVMATDCIAGNKDEEAIMWLSTNATCRVTSADDMIGFTIATGYHIYSEPMVYITDGACIEKLIGEMELISSKGNWTNDNISALCLLGLWTKKKFTNHPIAIRAEDASETLASLYSGTNAMTLALLSWLKNPEEPITKFIPKNELELLLNSKLIDLVERNDAVAASVLLLEYLWKDTDKDSFDHRLERIRDLAFVQASTAWNSERKHYNIKDSSKGPVFDTCIILILRGGFYGLGPVRQRPGFALTKAL